MDSSATVTELHSFEWSLTDTVTRLREWGSDRVYDLSAENDVWIGTTAACAIRLTDPTRRVSRYHARVARSGDTWYVRDLSLNGTRIDGARRSAFLLHAGSEVGIGPVTLMAESPRSIALRGYLARLLGWSSARAPAVDHALRAIRLASTGRVPLLVSAESDPAAIVRSLHVRTMGADRPFITCDPRRGSVPESVRSTRNVPNGLEALDAAEGGSLCVTAARLPSELPAMVLAMAATGRRVALFVCTTAGVARDALGPTSLVVPGMARRRPELPRIIDEYAADACLELGAPSTCFGEDDRMWITGHAARSLGEIETATTRLIALRSSGNVNRAAARLGMAHVSLARWIDRRHVPWWR